MLENDLDSVYSQVGGLLLIGRSKTHGPLVVASSQASLDDTEWDQVFRSMDRLWFHLEEAK